MTVLLAALGTDRLDEIAELRFTIVEGPEVRAWAWEPASGRVRLVRDPSAPAFVLGHPLSEGERALDARFLADSFWLAPQLHVRWAGAHATVVDRGPATFWGRDGRHLELRYAPTAGGYTPGDVHDLFTDEDGRLVGWSYHPGGVAAPVLTASFEDYVAVGPLELATVRRDPGGEVLLSVRELSWVPAGTTVGAAPGAEFLRIGPRTCAIGPVTVGREGGGSGTPGSRTRDLAEGDAPFRPDGVMSSRDGVADLRTHPWSRATLALEDAGWLGRAGFLGCDFGSLDEDDLARVLDGASPTDRSASLTVLLEWTLASGWLPPAASPLVRRIRRAALSCAETGRCEALLGWVGRVR